MISLSPEVIEMIKGIAALAAFCFFIWVLFGRD